MQVVWVKDCEFGKKIMNKLVIYEYLTYISLVLLILVIASWNSLINPSENIPRILPTIIYSLPLLILMHKLKSNKFGTYIMTSYVMLLYFVAGIGSMASDHTIYLGAVISILSLTIFISSILYVREKQSIS
jgi:uncharacterized membrane protein